MDKRNNLYQISPEVIIRHKDASYVYLIIIAKIIIIADNYHFVEYTKTGNKRTMAKKITFWDAPLSLKETKYLYE